MSTAQRLREQREQKGISQAQLAEQVGVHETTIRRWETGPQAPNAAVLQKLATALDTSVASLMGEDENSRSALEMALKLAADHRSLTVGKHLAAEYQKRLDELQELYASAIKGERGWNFLLPLEMNVPERASVEDMGLVDNSEPVSRIPHSDIKKRYVDEYGVSIYTSLPVSMLRKICKKNKPWTQENLKAAFDRGETIAPPYIEIDGKKLFDLKEIDRWIDSLPHFGELPREENREKLSRLILKYLPDEKISALLKIFAAWGYEC